jgi:hypothetical protein
MKNLKIVELRVKMCEMDVREYKTWKNVLYIECCMDYKCWNQKKIMDVIKVKKDWKFQTFDEWHKT